MLCSLTVFELTKLQKVFKMMKTLAQSHERMIYWEKQMDLMCGVHCVNVLLQGPYFNEVSLANIALELDAKERALMSEHGDTSDLKKYLKEGSGNVAEDGNYSIQVLSEALSRIGGLTITSIEAIVDKSTLPNEDGFICNSSSHWFTIRKVDNVWYNLNSTNRRMPEIVSEFYLSAFLMSIKEGGYQIFVARGKYPVSSPEHFDHLNKNQLWIPAKEIKRYNDNVLKKKKNFKLNIGGSDEVEYEKAIKRSLGQKSSDDEEQEFQKLEKKMEEEGSKDDKKNEPKFEAYKGSGVSIEGKVHTNYPKFEIADPNVDPELYFSIRMSMEEGVASVPNTGIDVVFRFEDGRKISRLFKPTDPIQVLYDFVFLKLTEVDMTKKVNFYLSEMFTKQKLLDVSLPISAIGEEQRLQLMINQC